MMRLLLALIVLLWASAVQAAGVSAPAGARVAPPGSCPGPPILPDEARAHELESRLQAAAVRSGPFELALSDREATSVLALRMSGLGLRRPQLWFLPGTACFEAHLLGLVSMTAWLEVGSHPRTGNPEIEVVRARVGPLEVPGFVRSFLSGVIRDSLIRAPGISIQSIELIEGQMRVRGEIRFRP